MTTYDFMARANALNEDLITLRRDFHRHPEIAFQENRTAKIVAESLRHLGLEVITGVGKTGVVAILEGNQPGATVLVRCDMDALPIHEENQTDYVSHQAGAMHACGHDGHMAIGLTVARMLAEQRENMVGTVKFVFQPAEEIGEGAQAMIQDGVLTDPEPSVSLGLHLWNDLPLGEIGITDGASMAGSDFFNITISGSGGHAASPHQTRDPLMAGVQIVNALQSIISRNVSPLEAAVLSVTRFHAGTADNVVPSEAIIGGTVRTYDNTVRQLIVSRMESIIKGIGEAMGCTTSFHIEQLTPPVINSVETNNRLRQAFQHIPLHFRRDVRTLAAEDVAFFLNAAPGTYLFVGSANAERGLNYPHHHPRFDFDEAALPIGAGLLATAVGEYVLGKANR